MKKQNEKKPTNQTKSYRIHENYFLLFNSCIQIYGDQKTELFLTLMKTGKPIDAEQFLTVPDYSKNEFIEHVLVELKRLEKPIEQTKELNQDPRAKKILKYYDEIFPGPKVSVLLQTKMPLEFQEFIKNYSNERIGEVLELAITKFINQVNDFEYELIEFLFKSKVDKVLNEKYSMELPFDTHTIYLQIDNKYYKLNSDFTKIQVDTIRKHSPKYPSVLLEKSEFSRVKGILLNKQNPHSLNEDTAKVLTEIGFMNEEELKGFLQK